MILLLIPAAWLVMLVLVVALCLAARLGDAQACPGEEPTGARRAMPAPARPRRIGRRAGARGSRRSGRGRRVAHLAPAGEAIRETIEA
jgi:hypothetical protein